MDSEPFKVDQSILPASNEIASNQSPLSERPDKYRQKLLDSAVAEAKTVLSQDGKVRYQCKSCERDFYDRGALRIHYSSVHLKLTYLCTVPGCGVWFNSKRSQMRHSANTNPQIHRPNLSKPIPDDAIIVTDDNDDDVSETSSFVSGAASDSQEGVSSHDLKRRLSSSHKSLVHPQIKRLKTDTDSITFEIKEDTSSQDAISLSGSCITGDPGYTASNVDDAEGDESRDNILNMDNTLEGDKSLGEATGSNSDSNQPLTQPTLNEFLSDLISKLKAQDVNRFFQYPMTDIIAPGYSKVLDNTIDMTRIQKKFSRGDYKTADEAREDIDLLYTNAMTYYPDSSPQYKEAAKLLKFTYDNYESLDKWGGVRESDDIPENVSEFPDTEEYPGPGSDSVFSRVRSDGKSSLAILNPYNRGFIDEQQEIGPGSQRCKTIGEQVGSLTTGTTTLSGYKEDRRNKVTPLAYLDYGPYASFGPVYDSSSAHCTKHDSDLLLSHYGENVIPGSTHRQTNKPPVSTVLMPLPNGGYTMVENSGINPSEPPVSQEDDSIDVDLIIPEVDLGDDFSLYLLNALTKDILIEERAKLGELKKAGAGEDEGPQADQPTNQNQSSLNSVAASLLQLQCANYRRLGQPIFNTKPSCQEMQLADKVVSGLTNLCASASPGQVASTAGVRKALGVVVSPDSTL